MANRTTEQIPTVEGKNINITGSQLVVIPQGGQNVVNIATKDLHLHIRCTDGKITIHCEDFGKQLHMRWMGYFGENIHPNVREIELSPEDEVVEN